MLPCICVAQKRERVKPSKVVIGYSRKFSFKEIFRGEFHQMAKKNQGSSCLHYWYLKISKKR